MRGWEVERTGICSDFRVRKRDPFTGREVESKLVEVKSGNDKPSDLQKNVPIAQNKASTEVPEKTNIISNKISLFKAYYLPN